MPSYADYLELNGLLSLQKPGDEHDEMLFIIIHQSYELWFKQILHEIDHLQQLLGNEQLTHANHTMKRVLTILKMLVSKVDILETMTPLEFLGFRDHLEAGSGFQSAQFREFEFVLGGKRRLPFESFTDDADATKRLEQRYQQPTLWDAFLKIVAIRGFDVPEAIKNRDVTQPIEPSAEFQSVLIDVYRNDSLLAEFCERLVDLDEGVQEWRYRHVKMVQRTIGMKTGTGGSSGAEYLQTTLMRPAFPDLWAIRTEF